MSGTVFGVDPPPITGVEHLQTFDPPRETTTGAIAALAFSGGSGVPPGGTIRVTATTAPLIVTGNTAAPATFSTNTLLQVVGAAGANARVAIDGMGGAGSFACNRINGTPDAPTATLINQAEALLSGGGYGTTARVGANVQISFNAAETLTDSAQGGYMIFRTTPAGSTTLTEAMRLQASGILTIGATTASGTNVLQVTGGISSDNVATSGYVSESTGNTLTATGSARTDALALTKQINNVTTAAASTGVILPSGVGVGTIILLFNGGANAIQVYASGAETIDGVAGATGVPLTNAKRCIYIAIGVGLWISAQLGVVSA